MIGRRFIHMQDTRARRDAHAYIFKPECTTVHEARFIVWQNSEVTQQIGKYSSNHLLFPFPRATAIHPVEAISMIPMGFNNETMASCLSLSPETSIV